MKKIALVLLSSTLLLASIYTESNRLEDMQAMDRSMSNIEAGILYNKTDKVKKGTVSLSKEINRVKAPLKEKEKGDLISKCLNYKVLCTEKIVKDIDAKSKIVLERFVAGDTKSATQAYTHIMKKCVKCHQQAHSW